MYISVKSFKILVGEFLTLSQGLRFLFQDIIIKFFRCLDQIPDTSFHQNFKYFKRLICCRKIDIKVFHFINCNATSVNIITKTVHLLLYSKEIMRVIFVNFTNSCKLYHWNSFIFTSHYHHIIFFYYFNQKNICNYL